MLDDGMIRNIQFKLMNTKPSSELEWLLYHLWIKTGPSPPQFIFTLADTVFYRMSNLSGSNPLMPQDIPVPECWYFTSKDGYILKKNRYNVSTKEIQKEFARRLEVHDQVAAIAYYGDENQEHEVIVQHLPLTDFKAILYYSPAANTTLACPSQNLLALQKFIPSKQIKNTVYRCKWSALGFCEIEMLQNINSFFDSKLPLDDRTPTFESGVRPELLVQRELLSFPQQVEDNINRSIKQMRDHLQGTSKVDLRAATFFFKIDKRTDNLILLNATNIEVAADSSSALVHQACLGRELEVRFTAWRRRLVIGMSSLELSMEEADTKILPPVQIQSKRRAATNQNSHRPMSSYETTKKLSQKPLCCPFCEKSLQSIAGTPLESSHFEVTINQIYKMSKFVNKKGVNFERLCQHPNFLISDFYKSISKDSVPIAIKRFYPSLNEEKLMKRLQDPIFLYENVKLCSDCYDPHFKHLLQLMKEAKDAMRSQREEAGKKPIGMPSIPKALPRLCKLQNEDLNIPRSHQLVVNYTETEMSQINKRSINVDDRDDVQEILFSLDKRGEEVQISRQQYSESNQPSSQLFNRTHSDNNRGTKSNHPNRRSGLDLCNQMILTQDSRQSHNEQRIPEESNRSEKPLMMMFSKVEAGKPAGEALVKVKKSSNTAEVVKVFEKSPITRPNGLTEEEDERARELEDRIRSRKARMLEDEKRTSQEAKKPLPIQRLMSAKERPKNNLIGQQAKAKKQFHRVHKGNELVERQREHVKERTRAVKTDIFETLEKIERGELVDISIPNNNNEYSSQVNSGSPQKELLNNARSLPGIFSLDIMTNQGQVPQFPSSTLIHDARMFDNNTPMVDMDQSQRDQIIRLKRRKEVGRQTQEKIYVASEERSESPKERKQSQKQRLMTAYGLSFPSMLKMAQSKQYITNKNIALGRIRPQSSKPPMRQTFSSQGQTQASQAPPAIPASIKPQSILQAYYSETAPEDSAHQHHSSKAMIGKPLSTQKTQRQLPSKKKVLLASQKSLGPYPTSTGSGGGLLDFNNMTEDHVMEIANKADELIEIIKNIKKNVKRADDVHENIYNEDQDRREEEGQQEQKNPNSWW